MIKVEYNVGEVNQEEMNKRMFVLGQLIIGEVKKKINEMGLVVTGDFMQGWFASIKGNELIIENRVKYAEPLEFGSYEYAQRFDENSFPKTPDPKKKDLPSVVRKALPKGMQPFAPLRRVLYDKTLMQRLIDDAFNTVI